jgi:hypothetical protein
MLTVKSDRTDIQLRRHRERMNTAKRQQHREAKATWRSGQQSLCNEWLAAAPAHFRRGTSAS